MEEWKIVCATFAHKIQAWIVKASAVHKVLISAPYEPACLDVYIIQLG